MFNGSSNLLADAKPDNITANQTTTDVGKQRRRRHRVRRNLSPNAITVEEGKTTTPLPPPPSPRIEESIQIVNGHIDGHAIDRNNQFAVFDGPLDPLSNYTGFVEVIGNYCHSNLLFKVKCDNRHVTVTV